MMPVSPVGVLGDYNLTYTDSDAVCLVGPDDAPVYGTSSVGHSGCRAI